MENFLFSENKIVAKVHQQQAGNTVGMLLYGFQIRAIADRNVSPAMASNWVFFFVTPAVMRHLVVSVSTVPRVVESWVEALEIWTSDELSSFTERCLQLKMVFAVFLPTYGNVTQRTCRNSSIWGRGDSVLWKCAVHFQLRTHTQFQS